MQIRFEFEFIILYLYISNTEIVKYYTTPRICPTWYNVVREKSRRFFYTKIDFKYISFYSWRLFKWLVRLRHVYNNALHMCDGV